MWNETRTCFTSFESMGIYPNHIIKDKNWIVCAPLPQASFSNQLSLYAHRAQLFHLNERKILRLKKYWKKKTSWLIFYEPEEMQMPPQLHAFGVAAGIIDARVSQMFRQGRSLEWAGYCSSIIDFLLRASRVEESAFVAKHPRSSTRGSPTLKHCWFTNLDYHTWEA